MLRRTCFTLATTLLLNPTAQAASSEPQTLRLEEVVVSASRTPMPLREVGASMSVLTTADIEARGVTTVAELLRTLPSTNVSNTGGLGKATSLRIRGEDGYRSKILLDGLDISDPTGTQAQAQIQHILTADIERIEVLRGPQGMMYGADSGGVINIITKKANAPFQGNIAAEYGRYSTGQLAGNLRGKVDDFDYSLSLADLSSDGFNARDSDTVLKDDDGYNNRTLNLSTGYQINQQLRVEASARNIDSDTELDDCYIGIFGSNICESRFKQSNYKLNSIYSTDKLSHQLSYDHTTTDRSQFTNHHNKTLDTEGKIQQLQYLGSYRLAAAKLVYGIDWKEEYLMKSSVGNKEREQTGLYLEWQGKVADAFYYTAGVRHDDNEDFGEHFSTRVTSAYLIPLQDNRELKIKGSYGTGFRAPSLFEIAYNKSPSAFAPASNISLKEESTEGFDAGIEYHTNTGLFIELIYFNQRLEDHIIFDLSNYSGYLQDHGTSVSKGVEFSFDTPINSYFSVNGNYTYNDTENAEGKQRIRRPRHSANLGLAFQSSNRDIKVNIDARHNSSAEDEIYGVGRAKLDDYETISMNIAYHGLPNITLYVRGENILGEDYQEVSQYNTSDAAAYGGFRYQF